MTYEIWLKLTRSLVDDFNECRRRWSEEEFSTSQVESLIRTQLRACMGYGRKGRIGEINIDMSTWGRDPSYTAHAKVYVAMPDIDLISAVRKAGAYIKSGYADDVIFGRSEMIGIKKIEVLIIDGIENI